MNRKYKPIQHKWLPFLATWSRPRATLRRILDEEPNFGVILIAIAVGVTAALRTSVLHGLHPIPDLMGLHPLLDEVIRLGVGASAGFLMTGSAVFVQGSLTGICLVAIGALILRLGGLVGGGHGHYREVRAAIAWSFVPYTVMLPAWLIQATLHFQQLREASIAGQMLNVMSFGWDMTATLLIDTALRLLCLLYLVVNLSEVHHIAPVKSLALVIIAFIPLTLVLIPWQGFAF